MPQNNFSRDVKFNESEHKEKTEINYNPVHYTELDLTDDTEPVSSPENSPTEQSNAEPILRRSERERKPPDFYGEGVNVVSQSPEKPRKQIVLQKNYNGRKQWKLR